LSILRLLSSIFLVILCFTSNPYSASKNIYCSLSCSSFLRLLWVFSKFIILAEFYLLILTLFSSVPFATSSITFPSSNLPVRPCLWRSLIGDLKQSYYTIRFTSPISIPSSATQVAIKVFNLPHLNWCSHAACTFCVIWCYWPRNTSHLQRVGSSICSLI
jgi:hypothetical protein